MRKKSFIASIVLTILNIFPTLFCIYLNSQIAYEGEASIALIFILPFTLIFMPIIILLLVLSLTFSIKAIKSENNKIAKTSKVLLIVNIIILLSVIVMIGRFVPLFLQ